MVELKIGEIALQTFARNTEDLKKEIGSQHRRFLSSRGLEFVETNRKYGPDTLAITEETTGSLCLATRATRDANPAPLSRTSLLPLSSNENAIGFIVARLIVRDLVSADSVRHAGPLPNGRSFLDLSAVRNAMMPKNLFDTFGQQHIIGFSGTAPQEPGVVIAIGRNIRLQTSAPVTQLLQQEIESILRLAAQKFRLSRGGVEKYGELSLRTEYDPDDPKTLLLVSDNLEPCTPDNTLLAWALINLVRPRRPNPFFPIQPPVMLPSQIVSADALDNGDRLADLPALRLQLMPSKVAQLLDDVHRIGGRGVTPSQDGNPAVLQLDGIRLTTGLSEREALEWKVRALLQPIEDLFRSEPHGEKKFGSPTLYASPGSDGETLLLSREDHRPGCPDEILIEYLLARLIQDNTIPRDEVRSAPPLPDGRSLCNFPTIQRQMAPEESVELIDCIHTALLGLDRRESTWKCSTE